MDFTYNWFSALIPKLRTHLGGLMGQPGVHVLEVGSFEGRSAVWFLGQLACGEGSSLTCIDPWIPTVEFTSDEVTMAERHFDSNLTRAQATSRGTLHKLKGRSFNILPTLKPETYDVIYIDGSHRAFDVLCDMVLAWRILKPGGMLICDDYDLEDHCSSVGVPHLAIDGFLACCGECDR